MCTDISRELLSLSSGYVKYGEREREIERERERARRGEEGGEGERESESNHNTGKTTAWTR